MVPPASATLVAFAAAVRTPPHVVAPAGVPVFTRPAGYVSVKAAPVIAEALVLVSVMVRIDGAFGSMAVGLKLFAMDGCALTVSVAEAAAAVPALVVVTAPVEFK